MACKDYHWRKISAIDFQAAVLKTAPLTGYEPFKGSNGSRSHSDGLAEQPAFNGSTVQKFNDGFGRDKDGMAPFKVQCSKVQLTLATRNLGFTCPSSSSRSKVGPESNRRDRGRELFQSSSPTASLTAFQRFKV